MKPDRLPWKACRNSQVFNALVTGGGRGIGAAIAAALTRSGARVTILGRDEAALAARVASRRSRRLCPWPMLPIRAGFEKRSWPRSRRKGAVDILVNNAGMAMSAPFLKTGNADFQRMLGEFAGRR